jgi:hypothetical protein
VFVLLPFAELRFGLQAQERRGERREPHPLKVVLQVLPEVRPSVEDRIAVFERLSMRKAISSRSTFGGALRGLLLKANSTEICDFGASSIA